MFFRCETGTCIYVVNLSTHRVTFWNDTLSIYQIDSLDPQPRISINFDDIVDISLSNVEDCV